VSKLIGPVRVSFRAARTLAQALKRRAHIGMPVDQHLEKRIDGSFFGRRREGQSGDCKNRPQVLNALPLRLSDGSGSDATSAIGSAGSPSLMVHTRSLAARCTRSPYSEQPGAARRPQA
jgi:hypothetical protein